MDVDHNIGIHMKRKELRYLLGLHPLCGGEDLLFLLSPPAAAFCFCSHSKTPTRIFSKYLQYAMVLRNLPGDFFF